MSTTKPKSETRDVGPIEATTVVDALRDRGCLTTAEVTASAQQAEPQWEIADDDGLILSDDAIESIAALLIDAAENEEKPSP